LTPRETVEFYAKLRGLDKAARARTWDRLSERLDLRDIGDRRVRGFSKGMRQRLGFAVSLVGDPDVLILDEPMSGLDPLGRRMIRELILDLKREGKTIFFSSHVLGDVQQISDRVGMLANGCMRAEGSLAELLGDRVSEVEVIARGLPADVEDALRARAARHRTSEDGVHLYVKDMPLANDLAREILANAGNVVELTPVKESLEEFFMREQTREEVAS
jgi:ABC-2 type transport system ATP-binding protein